MQETTGPIGPTGQQAVTIESISAVTLATRDMARATAFYEALGFRLEYGGPDAPFTSLAMQSGHINLTCRPAANPPEPWIRIIIRVSDVDAMHARALAHGLSPESSPCDAPWGERFFHISDPDGHTLSFARPLHAPRPGD